MTRRNDDDVVEWGGYDEEAVEGHQQEIEEASSNEFDKLKEGRNPRRILPPPRGSGWGPKGSDSPIRVVWEHVIEIPGADRPLRFSCPKHHENEPCFACDLATKLKRSTNPQERDVGYSMRARRVSYLQWFDPTEEEPEIKVYGAGKSIAESLVDLREEKGDFSHPVRGYQLTVKRTGSGRTDTRYKVIAGDTVPISDYDFHPDDLYDLNDYLNVPTIEEQEDMIDKVQALTGASGRRRSSSDDSERLSARRRRALSSGRSEDDDDRPRRRSRRSDDEDSGSSRSRRRRRSDEDDVIEAEVIEEEDEAPISSRRRSGPVRRRRRS